MGRPLGSKNKKKPASTARPRRTSSDRSPKKVCVCCGKNLAVVNYYRSNNPLHSDSLSIYCKDCVQSNVLNEDGYVEADKLKQMCAELNRPFDTALLASARNEFAGKYVLNHPDVKDERHVVAIYFKNVNSLPVYSNFSYQQYEYKKTFESKESKPAYVLGTEENPALTYAESVEARMSSNKDPIFIDDDDDDFEATTEIINKWGQGYSAYELKLMEEKYYFLSQSYPRLTSMHEETLRSHVRYKVLEEVALAEGRLDAAEKYANLAQKYADKGKMNPNQMSKSDLTGGLNSFSELLQAVEEAVDIIPILPQFKYRPADAVDFTIWCYVNYMRKLEGKPLCDYEDLYKFYDDRKNEYVKQYGDPYGIFKDDTTESNRDKISNFIKMPIDSGDQDV